MRGELYTSLFPWLTANCLVRFCFFSFKYSAIFYFATMLNSTAQARFAASMVLAGAYLLPLTWSPLIQTIQFQRQAVWLGSFLMLMAFGAFSIRAPIYVGGLLFAVGFGFWNSNFKALFVKKVSLINESTSAGLMLLLLSTNIVAIIAAFAVSPSLTSGISGLSRLFVICAIALLIFSTVWFRLQPSLYGRHFTAVTKHQTTSIKPSAIRFMTVGIVIVLVTLFWAGFELRTLVLNQIAETRLCESTWGLKITAAHLQAVNPISYLVLTPLFVFLLTRQRGDLIHPLYLVSMGISIMGGGLIAFGTILNVSSSCIGADSFIALYVLETVAELLLEPIGLAFVLRNSDVRFATFFVVLWECSSGAAYLLGGMVSTDKLVAFGITSLLGGAFLSFVSRYLKNYTI